MNDDAPLTPIISITDLNEIYNPQKSNLKEKMNKIIEEKDWEFDEVVEHNYAKAEVIDCLKALSNRARYSRRVIIVALLTLPLTFHTSDRNQSVALK